MVFNTSQNEKLNLMKIKSIQQEKPFSHMIIKSEHDRVYALLEGSSKVIVYDYNSLEKYGELLFTSTPNNIFVSEEDVIGFSDKVMEVIPLDNFIPINKPLEEKGIYINKATLVKKVVSNTLKPLVYFTDIANRRLVMVNTETSVLKEVQIDGTPDELFIYDDEILLSVCEKNKIMIFDSNSLEFKNEIYMMNIECT